MLSVTAQEPVAMLKLLILLSAIPVLTIRENEEEVRQEKERIRVFDWDVLSEQVGAVTEVCDWPEEAYSCQSPANNGTDYYDDYGDNNDTHAFGNEEPVARLCRCDADCIEFGDW